MFKTIKKLICISKRYDEDRSNMRKRIKNIADLVAERTTIDVDAACFHGQCSNIIVIGKYRGRDYIQTYSLQHSELDELIRILKSMEGFSRVRRVDSVPFIKAVIKKTTL